MRSLIRKAFNTIGLDVARYPRPQAPSISEQVFLGLLGLRDRPADMAAAFAAFCLRHYERSNAQLFQDLLVLFLLSEKRGGYFVEFGATNGISLSNTKLLEQDYGWRGILAEPAKRWHSELVSNRHCAIDTRCVWSSTGDSIQFRETKEAEYSTIDLKASCDYHAATRSNGVTYDVRTVFLSDLLREHSAPRGIDYMSIDTEGSELDILRVFDFAAYDIGIITVEHNHTPQRQEIYTL